jgi:ABC-type nitrate/sulfonate/bicarbonate transport system substrate-binding protein
MRKLTMVMVMAVAFVVATQASAAEKVRLTYTVQVHQAHMMILAEHARKYGVELDVVPMRRYADQQLALMTNQVDVAVMGYINVGLMEEKNFRDYRGIAGIFTKGQNLTLAKDVKATNWKDLEGHKLGTAPNSYAELIFKASAKLGGADMSKIPTVSFAAGGPPLLSALKAREIDGFVSWEPNNADAAVGGFGYYSTLDIADNPTHGVNGMLMVNAAFLQSKRAQVLGVLRAVIDATNALNADRERYVQVAVQGTGSPPEVVREAIPHGALDYKLYAKEAKALLKLIYDAKITPLDTSGAIEQQFDYSLLSEATGAPKGQLGGE